jgi:hypothetical protein
MRLDPAVTDAITIAMIYRDQFFPASELRNIDSKRLVRRLALRAPGRAVGRVPPPLHRDDEKGADRDGRQEPSADYRSIIPWVAKSVLN